MALPSISEVLYSASAREFDCVEAPMPKAANEANRANRMARMRPGLLVLEAALKGVHGAAEHLAGVVLHAVLHADEHLGVLRGDTQDAGDPHPEDAPGPPNSRPVPTPTMLPVPMVAARAVVSAPNWVMSPSALEGHPW